MKKIGAIFCLLLLLSFMGCQKQSDAPQRETARDFTQGFLPAESSRELVKVSENDRFVLYANLGTGEAAVEDKKEGYTWYTNPPDKQEDGLASGFNKNALLSALTVSYSTSTSVNMSCGGYMSSVAKSGLSYRLEEDGSVIFLFDFPNEEFEIPLRYAIDEERFTAQILTDGIREYGKNQITSIDVLPFFGAGGKEQEGYMLVPDGSGSLIYYNNKRTVANTYSAPLFGFDNGTNDQLAIDSASAAAVTLSENQYLPVFGVHQDDYGFLAVISKGEGRAGIKANISGKYTSYNAVWGSYAYRTIGTVKQVQKDGTVMSVSIAEKKRETWEDYEVSFYFLNKGEAEYADMAAFYRNYLIKNGKLERRVEEKNAIPLYLDLYGYLVKTKSFLGIPKDTKISMTTVEDVNRILDGLSEQGIGNVVVKYNYWMKNSFYDKIPTSAKAERKVGSKAQLLKLQERLEESGGALYLSADLMNVYRTGNKVSKYSDLLQSVANTNQLQYPFHLDAYTADSRYDAWYLLKPASMKEFFHRLASNMKKAGYHNIALDAIGQMCYSELSTNGMGRNQVTDLLEEVIAETRETMGGVLLSGANGYAAMQADHIINTSSRSSGYDIEDVSVPFYQMVFHGYASYSLEAINLASSLPDTLLKHMEYGAYPMYSLIKQNADELVNSRMEQLYSADYGYWEEMIRKQYAVLNKALGLVQTSVITEHEIIDESVRKTSFENGITVYVNYGSVPAQIEGLALKGKGYAVQRDGELIEEGSMAEGGGY